MEVEGREHSCLDLESPQPKLHDSNMFDCFSHFSYPETREQKLGDVQLDFSFEAKGKLTNIVQSDVDESKWSLLSRNS